MFALEVGEKISGAGKASEERYFGPWKPFSTLSLFAKYGSSVTERPVRGYFTPKISIIFFSGNWMLNIFRET